MTTKFGRKSSGFWWNNVGCQELHLRLIIVVRYGVVEICLLLAFVHDVRAVHLCARALATASGGLRCKLEQSSAMWATIHYQWIITTYCNYYQPLLNYQCENHYLSMNYQWIILAIENPSHQPMWPNMDHGREQLPSSVGDQWQASESLGLGQRCVLQGSSGFILGFL